MTVASSAIYLSMFYGSLTVGRLIFAPFIDRIGIFRCLIIWSAAGAVLYAAGFAMGRSGLILVAAAGLAYSILYPLLVMLIGKFFDTSVAGSATGLILSLATFFDIFFNAFFGRLAEHKGYGTAIFVLPAAAAAFSLLLLLLKFGVKRSKEIR